MSHHDANIESAREAATLRNAAGLFFFSVIILLEGNFRAATMVAAVSQQLILSFPAEALLAGGLCQMVFGFAGIFLAGAFAVGIKVRPTVVLVVLVLEGVMGWFIFLLFVFVNPGMEAAATTGIPLPWTSRMNYQTFVAMGILVSAGYCATLLGGQFSFTAGLYSLSQGKNTQDGAFYRSRGIVYSTLVFLTGLWLLIGGCVSSVLLPGPVNVVQPAMFVVWPGLFIATGCLAIVTGLAGVAIGLLPPRLASTSVLCVLHIVNCLWQVAVMSLYQPPVLGFVNPSTALTGLIISQLLPAYFHLMRCKIDGAPVATHRIKHDAEAIKLGPAVAL